MSSLENVFYLIHVPKTAGTTMRSLLLEHFFTARVVDSWSKEDVFERDPVAISQADLVLSHAGRSFSSYIQRGVDYCVFLRDPAELLISQYLQILKDPFHSMHGKAVGKSPREFIIDSGFAKAFENVQARHLFASSPADYDMLEDNHDRVNFRARRRRLEAFVEKFDVQTIRYAGTVADLPDVYQRICIDRRLVARPVPRLNTAHVVASAEIQDLTEELADYAALDRELIQRFASRNENGGSCRSLYDVARIKYDDTVNLPINSEFFADGWHPPEPSPDLSTWYRWSRESRVSILLPVTERLRSVTMSFFVHDPKTVENLRVELNGESLKYQIFRNHNAQYTEYFLNFELGKAKRGEPFSTLTLDNLQPIQPSIVPSEGDNRLLGVYLRRISLIF